MVWPNCAALLFISLHFKLKRHCVIHFLIVDVVKDRIDILIDLWFGIPLLFNTFPSVYQAKIFQEFKHECLEHVMHENDNIVMIFKVAGNDITNNYFSISKKR